MQFCSGNSIVFLLKKWHFQLEIKVIDIDIENVADHAIRSVTAYITATQYANCVSAVFYRDLMSNLAIVENQGDMRTGVTSYVFYNIVTEFLRAEKW